MRRMEMIDRVVKGSHSCMCRNFVTHKERSNRLKTYKRSKKGEAKGIQPDVSVASIKMIQETS
jgi:hypothetical protein